ncbi:MAG: hypothetical protein ACHQ4H_14260 [Ktedonobacterales bacterium]|jgi:hypothetical protein
MRCTECGDPLYRAGEVVPAGAYLRVDDGSFRRIELAQSGPLPATLDGHIGEYRSAATSCGCARRAATHGNRHAMIAVTQAHAARG